MEGDEEAASESGREGGLFCGFVDQLSDTKSHPRAVKSGENSVTTREESDFVPNEGKDSVRKMGPDPGQHQLREVKASEQGLFQWLLGSIVLVDTSPRGVISSWESSEVWCD